MAGRPGRSGGWNRLSDAEHALRGTTPRRPRVGLVARATAVTTDQVPPGLTEGLSVRGKAFVEVTFEDYGGWTPATLALLREAGLILDQLETVRGQPEERVAQRTLLAVLGALPLRA